MNFLNKELSFAHIVDREKLLSWQSKVYISSLDFDLHAWLSNVSLCISYFNR